MNNDWLIDYERRYADDRASAQAEANEASRVAKEAMRKSIETGEVVALPYSEYLSESLRFDADVWDPTASHTVAYSGKIDGKIWRVQLFPNGSLHLAVQRR